MPTVDSTKVNRSSLRSIEQLFFDHAILFELARIACNLERFLADAVITLSKEEHGYLPVFALDFDVLHAYMFPTLQTRRFRGSPTVVQYVIDNAPVHFAFPPGTVSELVSYVNKAIPLARRVQQSLASRRPHALDSSGRADLFALYSLLIRDDPSQDRFLSQIDQLAFFVSEALAEFYEGFAQLRKFITSGRVVGLDALYPGWEQRYDPNLAERVAIQINARSGALRPKRSNQNDSRNVAAIQALDDVTFDKDMFSASRPNELLWNVRLLSSTKAILDLPSKTGHDRVATTRIKIFPTYLRSASPSWLTSSLGSAAVYTALRNQYPTVNECVRRAEDQFIGLTKLSVQLSETEALLRRVQSTPNAVLEERQKLETLISSSPVPWYYSLRRMLMSSSLQRNAQSADETQIEDNHDLLAISQAIHNRRSTYLSTVTLIQQSKFAASDPLVSMGLRVNKLVCSNTGHKVLWLWSLADQSTLLIISEEPSAQFVSIQWPVSDDPTYLPRLVAAALNGAAVAPKASVTATYEIEAAAGINGEVNQRTLEIPNKQNANDYSSADFERSGNILGLDDVTLFPKRLAILSTAGDAYFDYLNPDFPGAGRVVLNSYRQQLTEENWGDFFKTTHLWSWNTDVIDYMATLVLTRQQAPNGNAG